MIKELERVIDRVEKLSAEQQRVVAAAIASVVDDMTGNAVYVFEGDEAREIDDAIAEADRGEFASKAEVRAVFDKYR